MTKIISWNVNGIRAIEKKGFFEWLHKESPDVLCIQETKADKSQLSETILNQQGYESHWSSCRIKKGYSGVAVYTKIKPNKIEYGIGIEEFDQEGRFIILHFDAYILFNIYFPNGSSGNKRVPYKMSFYDAFYKHCQTLLNEGKKIIVTGDVNTAHTEIDLSRPKNNEKNTGFLPEEREWVSKFIELGFIDTFRMFNEKGENYTWWDYKTRARERNVGWRIDYFFVSNNMKEQINSSIILNQIMGSDHCPIKLELK
ncbi:exodeoxyribonuclease III [Candidatus Woesearchaeota archaeon]|jgi:exodeoxyribonuclease III|nr:exodeoxyribonuclease III [Candidatus Woesearchaeota archaeon]MBT4387675.1 exodeoxyribonuclease III [Candidatus Woesearchaeota archaeon]MBT4595962.1 exodeoxyribonuclease III [Candidatus Woesearchaeota archaeon]MBT5741092.1 exodeoxyribonuclease III [Candidatus Woesearchaeota archaeon]MBT6505357.1 exodeoxyribonuclease III [Candidatus Woesearchaeota archaeon]